MSLTLQVPKSRSGPKKSSNNSPAMEDFSFTSFQAKDTSTSPSIYTINSIGDDQPSISLSIIKSNYIPEDASNKEMNIQQFLDSMFVYQVNVKGMLEEEFKD